MTLGFIDNSQRSVEGAVLGAIWNGVTWVVGTTVTAISGLINQQQAQQPQQATQEAGVSGNISFEPWGPDPYEPTQTPEVFDPVRELLPEVLPPEPALPAATQPVSPLSESTAVAQQAQGPANQPQSETKPGMVPIPVPNVPMPAGGQQLGGYGFQYPIFQGTRYRFVYGNSKTSLLTGNFNRVTFTFQPVKEGETVFYKPRVIATLNGQTVNTFTFDRKVQTIPLASSFDVYVDVQEFEEEWVTYSINQDRELFFGTPLPNTYKPTPQPAKTPEREEEPKRFPGPITIPQPPETEPAPLPQPETEPDKAPLPQPPTVPIPAPPVPAPEPEVGVPIDPNSPTPLPPLDNEGKPIPLPLPPATPNDQHTVNGNVPVGGTGPRPDIAGVAKEVGRIEQKLAKMMQQAGTGGPSLAELLLLLESLLGYFQPNVPGDIYRLVSVCEKDEDGEPVSRAVEQVIPSTDSISAILSRLDALVPLLQGQKDFKQPICRDKVQPQGDYRTISFISDERSAAGDGRLRKRFRYRSQSGVGLAGVVDHWRDFVWDAGPVCVQHSGHHWGTPQVWAASVDEGKRVIQHAGREAGIDPDQVGKWTVSGSDNPRFGMSGTMRVNTKGGYYWITERLGSNGRPLVGAT